MDFLNDLVEEVYTGKVGKAGRVKFNDFLLAAAKANNDWDKEYSRKDILKINVQFRAEKLGIDLDGELSEDDVETMKAEAKKGAKQLIGCLSKAQDNGGFNYWAGGERINIYIDLDRKSEDIYQFIVTEESWDDGDVSKLIPLDEA